MEWFDWFFQGDFGSGPPNWPAMILGLLLAFGCGHIIAWVYMLTHSGLSYSRSFVNSLIIMPVIVSLVMMVLSNNLITAFGMMAVFAIVRFRNILRDVQEEHQLTVLARIKELGQSRPNRCAIVIYGKLTDDALDKLQSALGPGGLLGFVRDGGALFVASDQHSTAYRDFGIAIDGKLLRANEKSLEASYYGD